jgi:hypothetical protein
MRHKCRIEESRNTTHTHTQNIFYIKIKAIGEETRRTFEGDRLLRPVQVAIVDDVPSVLLVVL